MTGAPRSIGRRLARNLGLSLGALWFAGVIATGVILYHEQGEMLDDSLRVTAELLLPLARAEYDRAVRNKAALPVVVGPPHVLTQEGAQHVARYRDLPLVFMLRDGRGAVVVRSANTDAVGAVGSRQSGYHEIGDYIVYQTAPDGDGFQIVVGGLLVFADRADGDVDQKRHAADPAAGIAHTARVAGASPGAAAGDRPDGGVEPGDPASWCGEPRADRLCRPSG